MPVILTQEQKEIVEFYGAPLRVLAGPGTGKTMCLVEKVNFLIKTKKVSYTNISLVTFTRAAAGELRNRIQKSGIDSDKLPYVNTLHGFAMNALKKYFPKTGLKTGVQPINNSLTRILISDVIYELAQKGIVLPRFETKMFINAHFQQKANAGIPREIEASEKNKKILLIFSNYFHEHLEFYNAIDWADILIKTIELLNKDPEVKKEVHEGTKHLLVDEFQDLSPLEQKFIEQINSDKTGLCIVGDDDQSIYETFRFADPTGLINFPKKYSNGKSLEMSICWRCPPAIINVALQLIGNNKIRATKSLKAANDKKKGFVVCISHKSKNEEIKWLVSKILEIKGKKFEYEDVMVLFTDSKIAKGYVAELQENNIPLSIQLKISNIFDSDSFLGLFSIMKLLINPPDNLNLRYCLHTWKGIGSETVRQLRLLSISSKTSLWEAIENVSQNLNSFKFIKNRSRIRDFYIFYRELSMIKDFTKVKDIYFNRFSASKNDKGCNIFFENLDKFSGKEEAVTLKEIIEDFEQKNGIWGIRR